MFFNTIVILKQCPKISSSSLKMVLKMKGLLSTKPTELKINIIYQDNSPPVLVQFSNYPVQKSRFPVLVLLLL